MRILCVAESNVRAGYRYRIGLPLLPPTHDPMLSQYCEDRAADEEVAAILASVSPINVAPLVMFAVYGSPQLLYPELGVAVDNESVVGKKEEEVARVWEVQDAVENAERIFAKQAEAQALTQEEEEAARVRLLRDAEAEESMEEEENEITEEEEASEEEGEEEEAHDSGVDSDADDLMDESSSASSSSDDEDVPYDSVRDPE
ncbi:hypothetical protein TSAR_003801 [Trichomalopsis sarcophagae]|uniref:Uncharacterized protein n=1 Tax=Trichomalopsis sarcophagae TaxID=543379 RepID=A0A232EMI5_9HYME|nr:hypothetical protein TSAR_003801 [Trichomalopsis sarcophagae]